MNVIYAVNIDGFDKRFDDALWNLSEANQKEVLRFKQKKDRHRKLVSMLLLHYLAKKHLEVSDYSVLTNEFGKPFLKNYPEFQFNISHSGDWVVASVANKPVGIDVEVINEIKDFMGIAARFYSDQEYEHLTQCKEDFRLDMFFDIWTKKESLIKAVGKGLSISLKSFTVPFSIDGCVNYSGIDWYISAPVFCDKKYKIALCSSEPLNPIVKNYLQFSELL